MSAYVLVTHLDWMHLRGLSERTISARSDAVRRLARHLDLTVDDLPAVVEADLDRWQRDLAHLTARYRADYTGQIRRFFGWMLTNGIISTDPSRVLVSIKTVRGLPRPISEADLAIALTLASSRVRPWMILAAYAGLRAGEVAHLCREDVQDTAVAPLLRVLGKGGKERLVPMSGLVVRELRAIPMPSRGPLFPRLDGQPGHVTAQLVSSLGNRSLHGSGIPDSFHSLRHRFATRAYDLCRDLRVVQELLGHSSPAVTAVYTAWSRPEAAKAVAAVAGELIPA